MDYEVLSPWADVDAGVPKGLMSRVGDLRGKTIGLYSDWKWHSPMIMKELGGLLKERYPTAKFSHFQFPVFGMDILQNAKYKAELEEWVKTVDAVITGYGDTKSCTLYLAYDSAAIEDRGKPVIMLVKKGFEDDARSAASVKSRPGLRIVTTTIPTNTKSADTISEGLTKEVIDNLITAMTRPLTAEEKTPTRKQAENHERIIFKGSLAEVNRFFYQKGWTDGLPVIPPSEEAVKEMLQGTDLPADHVVARLPLKFGKATVEKIAVNAVMAGALPTYMPVLIAAVQAFVNQPETRHVLVTMISVGPCWIINGPIRNDIDINSGLFLLSSGTMANSVIARAMQLIIKNIGNAQPGIDLKKFYGHQGAYSLAFSENEEESPWEPLHVEQGLNKEDSAVSLFFVTNNAEIMGAAGNITDDKLLLSYLSDSVADSLDGKGIGVGGIGGANSLFAISPGAARLFASNGWTKEKLYAHILDKAKKAPRNDKVRKYESYWGLPEKGLKVIVAGGMNNYNTAYQFQGGFMGWITQKVELPAKWNELVKKYKDIVAPNGQDLKVK